MAGMVTSPEFSSNVTNFMCNVQERSVCRAGGVGGGGMIPCHARSLVQTRVCVCERARTCVLVRVSRFAVLCFRWT